MQTEDFKKIYLEYFDLIYNYSLSICKNPTRAEDITRETFLRAMAKIETFRGESKFSVWLCRIAKNLSYSYLRKEMKTEQLDDNEKRNIYDPEEKIETDRTASRISLAMDNLPDVYKEVFRMRAVDELTFWEVGSLYDKSDSWARVTYHRAKIKIREMIK